MTPEAKKILDMIESVDPADTETLDEIDARFWCWVHNAIFYCICPDRQYFNYNWQDEPTGGIRVSSAANPRFTRSRDALKSVRPEGWKIELNEIDTGYGFIVGAQCILSSISKGTSGNVHLPNEELAELHAIIQAIDYERTHHDQEK